MQLSRSFGDDVDGFAAAETFLHFRLDDVNVHTWVWNKLNAMFELRFHKNTYYNWDSESDKF